MILCFAIVGFLIPDVSDLREEVGDEAREALRPVITAEVKADMDPYYYTPEDIAVEIAYELDTAVDRKVSAAVGVKFGLWTLIPAFFLIIYIFATKRIVEALTLATVLGCIMAYKGDFFELFNDVVLGVLMDEDMAWLITVCGLMGGIVAVIEKSGGGFAFANLAQKIAKTPRQTLLATMFCSLLLCIDDYLAALTTGIAMTSINDKHRTPREMTSYVIDSTAAPACVLMPFSTWALFIGGLMVKEGLGEPGTQVLTFIKTVPYSFYSFATLLIVFLVVIGVIPVFGPMKSAYKRVAEGGPTAPPGSERIDIRSGAEAIEVPDNPKIYNFFAPILLLIGATFFFEFDMQMGVITTVAFCFLFFVAQGMEPMDFVDQILRGLKNMLLPLLLMVLAFSFADMCDYIGFIEYIIALATTHVTPPMLFVTLFIVFMLTEFIMGINWGMYIIALPIAVPVALGLGVDPFMAVGAITSAGVWGSHSCFYSDATVLVSAATGCDNFRHAYTQIPYGIMGGVLAIIGFIVLGQVMYG